MDHSGGASHASDTNLKASPRLAPIQKKSIEAAGLTPAGVYGLFVKCGHGFEVVFMTTLCVTRTPSDCSHKNELHVSVLPFQEKIGHK